MVINRYSKIAVLLLTGISLFWFPWIVTEILMFVSALFFPPAAPAYGIVADVLYYPGSGYPVGLITGAAITLLALLVRYFVKTRIM